METFINTFQDFFETWGYVALFFYCMGSGYVGILAAGALATFGHTDLSISILVAAAGNFFGSSLLVILMRYQKKDFERFLIAHRRKIALMHIWLKKYGALLILVNKYLYGVKFLVPVAIGVSRYDMRKFLLLNVLSSIVWALSLGVLAFYFSQAIVEIIESYGQYSYGILALLFVAFILVFIVFGRKKHASLTKPNMESSTLDSSSIKSMPQPGFTESKTPESTSSDSVQ